MLQVQSDFSKFIVLIHFKYHHSKRVNFKFQLKLSTRLDVHNFVYHCCLRKVNYGYQY